MTTTTVRAAAPWLQVLGGRRFDLAHPTPDMVNFEMIATVLAGTPRFTRHTEGGAYSVAQHSVEGAYAILRDTGRRNWAAAFLLHDAHEAYIGDMATPVKDALIWHAISERGDLGAGEVVRDAVRSLKASLDEAIYIAAGIPWPLSYASARIVHEYDSRMCRTERDACMAPPPEPWAYCIENAAPVEGCVLSSWSEDYAAIQFRVACRDLLPPS